MEKVQFTTFLPRQQPCGAFTDTCVCVSSGIYEIFCKETFGVKAKNLEFGLQPYKIPQTETVRLLKDKSDIFSQTMRDLKSGRLHSSVLLNVSISANASSRPVVTQVCYLMPSSSPRCAQFPRAQDKVHFYIKLKELRDQMRGQAPSRDVQETDYTFDLQLAKGEAVPSCMCLCDMTVQRHFAAFVLQRTPRGWQLKRSRRTRSMTSCPADGAGRYGGSLTGSDVTVTNAARLSLWRFLLVTRTHICARRSHYCFVVSDAHTGCHDNMKITWLLSRN